MSPQTTRRLLHPEDPIAEEQAHLRRLLDQHKRNLQKLELDAARFGAGMVPLPLQNQIENEEAAIQELENRLKELGRPVSPPAPGPVQDNEAVVAAYLETMRSACGLVETRPYKQLSEFKGAADRFPLLGEGGIYTPLRFDWQPGRPVSPLGVERKKGRDEVRRDISLAEMLALSGNLAIIGQAGCGKTTVLRLVATVLACADPALAKAQLGLDAASPPLPVFVALRNFEHACQTRPHTYHRDVQGLLRFVDDHFQRWHPDKVPHGFLSAQIQAGRCWLLLDALDEVADPDHRALVRQIIERLADDWPDNRYLVTARVAAYAGAQLNERFDLATVRDLTPAQWQFIASRLYAGLEPDPDVAAERARLLVERIESSDLLQEMVKTPLMVWTATIIHYAGRQLPEQRAELYHAYVSVLLGERLHEEEGAEAVPSLRDARWPAEDRRLYLAYAAYQTHELAEPEQASRREQDALVVVDEQDLVRRILAPFMQEYLTLERRRDAEKEAAEFLNLMAERSGILYQHEGGYSFGDHLTVQEFLAANYLVDNLRGRGEAWTGFLQEHVGRSWWREVFLLMAGYLLQWPQQARRFLLPQFLYP